MTDPHESPNHGPSDAHGSHDREGDHGDAHHHDHHAHDVETFGAAVVTISSTRTLENDPSGDEIVNALEHAGHTVVTRELIDDEYDSIQTAIDALIGRRDVDVVVTTGGTGVTPDDVTVEAVRPLCDKVLPGFGELFRRRSEAEVGTRVIATRAIAGIADGVLVVCLPGSVNAVSLGIEIIEAEAGHLVGLITRDVEEE